MENILNRSVPARNDSGFKVHLNNNVAIFDYTSWMGDSELLDRVGIARYRIQGARAIREAPIATQFGGFLSEWLSLDDDEAARWSSPQAAQSHHALVEKFKKGTFDWSHVAVCPDSSREIAIKSTGSNKSTAFTISATTAEDMRMRGVPDSLSPACTAVDIQADLSSVTSELAR